MKSLANLTLIISVILTLYCGSWISMLAMMMNSLLYSPIFFFVLVAPHILIVFLQSLAFHKQKYWIVPVLFIVQIGFLIAIGNYLLDVAV